jgi:Predicted metal-dependent hydrolase of the TIM-barrel fold
LPLIDAHCHVSPLWFEPVETLLFQMEGNGVEKAVLTQILGQFDNSYQRDCVTHYPDRFVSIGAVNAAEEGAADQVATLAADGMAGLRLRPDARSPGDDPLAIWRAAASSGLVISCGGASEQLLAPEFAELVDTFPDVPFVVEHLGGWTRPDCDKSAETWNGILGLARFPNISIKIPALGQIISRGVGKPLPAAGPVLDPSGASVLTEALAAFGPERLMWGSDFPVVSSREGYANALAWTRQIFEGYGPAVVDAIFGMNAQRIFFQRKA